MTVPRKDLDADKQPVWTEPSARKRKSYKWNSPQEHTGKGVLAFLALVFGGFLTLIGLSQK